MINALQTLVSRETNPANAVVISICTIHAGEANNIVPDSVEMTGTVRTLNPGGSRPHGGQREARGCLGG